MNQGINVVGLYVDDQDEALAFYVDKLGFRVHTDVRNGDYRWLTVQHPEQASFQLGLFTPGPPMHDPATAQTLRALLPKAAIPPSALPAKHCPVPSGRTHAGGGRGVTAGTRGPLRHRRRRLPRSFRQRLEDDPGAALEPENAHELFIESLDPAVPSLGIDCLHADRGRQLPRDDAGAA